VTLGHQTTAAYAIIGRITAVYSQYTTLGDAPHVVLTARRTW